MKKFEVKEVGLKKSLLAVAIGLAAVQVQAAIKAPLLEEMVIIGSREDARAVAGSGAVIDAEQIMIEASTDINQLLKTVPGVYIREEDGAGLRPNIGIRGATSERSEKITLLEDGVMIAPAPYTAPSAYYFPTSLRMSSLEVLKGAPLLRYGPQTTGGVVNMVSTPVPTDTNGHLKVIMDEHGSTDILANVGGQSGQWRYLAETVQRDGAGFKDVDRSGDDSGFEIEDYMFKLGWESAGNGPRQTLLLKGQYSEETSRETYLGLTDADFDADEDRRYGLSAIDEMNNRHKGLSLTHSIELSDALILTTTAYRNEFGRDWFKLSGGGKIVAAANGGDASAQAILDGSADKFDLTYKHNNRNYISEGLQTNASFTFTEHQLDLGVRMHHDEMDRYQKQDIYSQESGQLIYQSTTAPTGSNNREEEADAISLWAVDQWQLTEALNLSLALRYEKVDSRRYQYGDAERTVLDNKRTNSTEEWLPGISFTYDVSSQWQLLAGVHRGFSPLGGGAKENEDPETSTNWEAGVRYNNNGWFAEAIGFYSDFDNKIESCSVGSPCSNGDTSGTFSTGESVIQGLELQVSKDLAFANFQVPVSLAYTYTSAEIVDDNPTKGTFDGDKLKDVPENVFSLRAGLEHSSGWNNYAVVKYIDDTCISAGCNRTDGDFDQTESLWVVDVISRYPLNTDTEVFLKVENLFDERAIVSRSPDGARPNKPFTASIGVDFSF